MGDLTPQQRRDRNWTLRRKVEILEDQVETLERGMFKLHYQMIKAGLEPGDDLYTLAGYETEILLEILGKAKIIIEKEDNR